MTGEDSPLWFPEGGLIKIDLDASDLEDPIREASTIPHKKVVTSTSLSEGEIIKVNLRSSRFYLLG